MADGEKYKMLRDMPEPEVGGVVEFDGKSLTASKIFKDGKEAQESGLKYFMKTSTGSVIGFAE